MSSLKTQVRCPHCSWDFWVDGIPKITQCRRCARRFTIKPERSMSRIMKQVNYPKGVYQPNDVMNRDKKSVLFKSALEIREEAQKRRNI